MELSPSTMLKDRYRIREKIAAGGMGAVYLAHDTALDALVAIKANINPGEHSARQFLREAKLLAALRHLNLPRVTDYFVIEDAQYLVMDFVPGEDLGERLKTAGPQHLDRVLDWSRQLGQALTYLHTHDPPIIHRDIKPSNIKLTPQGQLILVDFGIAKSSDSGSTTTGARGLTPGFSPPEQYGSGGTTEATDQYALAATLYNLLTGEEPAEAVQRMLGNVKLTPPREVLSEIPDHIDSALRRALAIQPEDRFPDVEGFIAALGDPSYTYQASQLRTVKAERQERAPASSARWPLVVAVVAVAAVAVAALLFRSPGAPDADITATAGGMEPTETSLPAGGPASTASPTVPLPSETPGATHTPTIMPTPLGGGPLIAFVSDRADGRTFQIFTIRPDGSDLTQLTFTEGDKSQPAWSPDGTQLLFVAHGGRDGFSNDLGLDIWLMDQDGGNQVNLTQNPGDDYDPAWSPDGEQIVFTTTRITGGPRQLFIMNADGSEPNFITRGYGIEFAPHWSPDGEWIAFTISINGAPPRLFLRTGEGIDPRPFDLSERLGQVNDPAWSPDGLTIVYTCVEPGRNEICLVVVESKGSEIFEYTTTLGNKEPSWSPDGRWIVFTSTRDQNSEIYIMDSLGRGQTNLTNHPSTDREPTWQPPQ